MNLPHPTADQITLPNVLSALGDDTRLAIVGLLARNEATSMTCGQFCDLGSKTSLSYHLAKLREAELVAVERHGTTLIYHLNMSILEEALSGFLAFREHDE